MKNLMRSLILLLAIVIFSQCANENPTPEPEKDVINTMTLTFSPVGGGTDMLFIIENADGPEGPNEPVYTNGILALNTQYNVSIELLNKSGNPVEDITEIIAEQADEYQFFFIISNGLDLNFAYDDVDSNGNPVGLRSNFFTGVVSSGTLSVELKHEPNKNAEGVSNGLIDNAGGETDIQAVFNVVIK